MPRSSLSQVALHLDTRSESVLTTHDNITNVQKRLGNRVWVGGRQCGCCGSFLDPHLGHADTCSTAEATRGHNACVHAVVCGMKLADPGITTEPRGLTASQSRPADIFTTAAVPRRSAALDTCACLPPLHGHLAETPHRRRSIVNTHRNEIGELRQQGTHYHTLVRTTDGRPHPAVTRMFQSAADIASSRNGQHLSAKSLQCG